jgi:hypothetical protein
MINYLQILVYCTQILVYQIACTVQNKKLEHAAILYYCTYVSQESKTYSKSATTSTVQEPKAHGDTNTSIVCTRI